MALVRKAAKTGNLTALGVQQARYKASGHEFKVYIDAAVLLRDRYFRDGRVDGFSTDAFNCQVRLTTPRA